MFLVLLDYNALDEMGNRIDELEQSINDLKNEMGVDASPSPSIPPKPRVELKAEGSPSCLNPKVEPKPTNDSA